MLDLPFGGLLCGAQDIQDLQSTTLTQNQYGDKKGPTPATWLGGCPFVHGSLGGLGGCEGFAMVLSPGVDNNI